MRHIGIRHRRKRTAEGEARPTELAIAGTDETEIVRLQTEEDELQFVKSGLKPGDTIAMVLGGSGDRLAYALSRRAEELGNGTKVLRIPSFTLKSCRNGDKEEDALFLVQLAKDRPHLFYEVSPRDRQVIMVVECFRSRVDAMKARIACEQRFLQRLIGRIFLSSDGFYPEGKIEDWFDGQKANDKILNSLIEEEKQANKTLEKAVKDLDVYTEIFAKIEGVGPAIASRLIAAIQDIRRFETPAKLKRFLGVHVTSDGRLPRRRVGQVANWHPDGRQALYLLSEQFNRRPNSIWGKKLRENKARLRLKHPEKIIDDNSGKSRYSDGHIHKMAVWRTLSRFVEWLWSEWTELEKQSSPTIP